MTEDRDDGKQEPTGPGEPNSTPPNERKVRLRKLASFYNKSPEVHTVTVISEYNGIEIEVHVPVKHDVPGLDTLWEQAEEFFRETANLIARQRAATNERDRLRGAGK